MDASTAAIPSESRKRYLIAEELGRQYSLGYYPVKLVLKRREIKVKMTDAGLVVKARDSYIYTEKGNKLTQATRLIRNQSV